LFKIQLPKFCIHQENFPTVSNYSYIFTKSSATITTICGRVAAMVTVHNTTASNITSLSMVVNFIPLQVHPYLKEENQQNHFTQHGREFHSFISERRKPTN
jgi:hypothetical protein